MKKIIKKMNYEESGQIVILLAISLVVLLVIAALAIDGGMVYTERRFAQNAADSSSLGAAGFIANYLLKQDIDYSTIGCSDLVIPLNASEETLKTLRGERGGFVGAGESQMRAASNNFTDLQYQGVEIDGTWYPFSGGDVAAKHGIIISCSDSESPAHDKHIDVKVRITTETQTAFLHLVFPDNLTSTVEAVTRVYPRHSVGFGNALLSDKNQEDCTPSDKCGISFSGTSGTVITGGGVHSDSIITANGTTNVNVEGYVTSHDPVIDGIDKIVSAGTSGGQPYNENIVVDMPNNCPPVNPSIKSITLNNGDSYNAVPGSYEKITNNGGTLTFEPGLYCITKSQGISITGGITEGSEVTFYMIEGAVTINATGEYDDTHVTLTSPDVENPGPLGGWLILVDPANTSAIDITGSGGSYYAGAIFSPDGLVKIAGSADPSTPLGQEYSTQIIAKSIAVVGTATVNINFDASKVPQVPSTISLLN